MSENKATRIVFADQLKAGDIIVSEHSDTERTVTAVRGDDKLVSGVADENGEQVHLGYGTNTTVRILIPDTLSVEIPEEVHLD